MRSGGKDTHPGWVGLPYRFSKSELDSLAKHDLFTGRGRRLANLAIMNDGLPKGFRACLQDQGFDSTVLRAVGFNKTLGTNWSLPWHQDRVVAMPTRIMSEDYTNWTRKNGIWHCEPSENILKSMAFAYIAFDPMSENEGGIELAEGSHVAGKIRSNDILATIAGCNLVKPSLQIGECLLIRALTLHRSASNQSARPRRALRPDFCATR